MNKNVVKFPNAELIPAIVEMLHEGHNVKLRLRGFSMRPFLEDDRDIALLTLPKQSSALFRMPERLKGSMLL